jgi:hypothetical protein
MIEAKGQSRDRSDYDAKFCFSPGSRLFCRAWLRLEAAAGEEERKATLYSRRRH